MPLFYFILKAGQQTLPDMEGEEFDHEGGARDHAHIVARELMRNRESQTRHWRLQVCDDYLQPRYECLFADLDETLRPFEAGGLRASVIAAARTLGALGETFQKVNVSLAELRNTLGRIK